MDYLHYVLLKNNNLEWIIKETEMKHSTTIINPVTGLEIKKRMFIPVPYIPSFGEEFKRIFHSTVYM